MYDFADESTAQWYEELNRKEEVTRQKKYEKYMKAVDIVCIECIYNDEKFCKKCPVRKTVDITPLPRKE